MRTAADKRQNLASIVGHPGPSAQRARRPRAKSPTGRFLVATCRFGLRLRPDQLDHFKGAVVQKADQLRWPLELIGVRPSVLHGRDDDHPDWDPALDRAVDRERHVPVLHEPPVTYFRVDGGRATITGLQAGARALLMLVPMLGEHVRMEGRDRSLWPWDMAFGSVPAGGSARPLAYGLERWAFLKEVRDVQEYDAILHRGDERQRIAYLERKLVNQIAFLYQVAGEDPGGVVQVRILDDRTTAGRRGPHGDPPGRLMDLRFETNVHLPPGAGLGAATRMGHGRIVASGA